VLERARSWDVFPAILGPLARQLRTAPPGSLALRIGHHDSDGSRCSSLQRVGLGLRLGPVPSESSAGLGPSLQSQACRAPGVCKPEAGT
jgi:hypothetical protein